MTEELDLQAIKNRHIPEWSNCDCEDVERLIAEVERLKNETDERHKSECVRHGAQTT